MIPTCTIINTIRARDLRVISVFSFPSSRELEARQGWLVPPCSRLVVHTVERMRTRRRGQGVGGAGGLEDRRLEVCGVCVMRRRGERGETRQREPLY